MCLSIPSKVVEISEENMATVDTFGVRRKVTLDLISEKVEVDDYVLIHVGFAISKINKEEALISLDLYQQIFDAMKDGGIDEEEGNMNYVKC